MRVFVFIDGSNFYFKLKRLMQERGDPPVAVARPGVDQGPEARQQLGVFVQPLLQAAWLFLGSFAAGCTEVR